MGYCLCSRNWIVYIWTGIWQLDSSCKTEQCLVSKPSVWLWDMIWMWFNCVLDFRFLVSVHAWTLVLTICMWYLATCIWQLVSCIVLINQFTWFNLGILLRYMALFYIPASSQYYIFQLQVQLYFHFQLDFLLPVLVYDKSSPDMLSWLARDAMLYYIVLEYSMYSIWIVLTITWCHVVTERGSSHVCAASCR